MSTVAAQQTTLTDAEKKFVKRITNPFMFRLYLLYKLPLAFVSGMKITELSKEHAVATINYKWLTQNPFRSTYFAALAMAAEASNGVLALLAVEGRKPSVAVIIVDMKAQFIKKATDLTTFTCNDGHLLFEAADKAAETGEATSATVKTIGRSKDGTVVAEFELTWSFKRRG